MQAMRRFSGPGALSQQGDLIGAARCGRQRRMNDEFHESSVIMKKIAA